MKYLVLIEGNTDKALIEILMGKGIFKISADDMLDLRPHQKRQIDTYLAALIRQLNADEKVKIIRIGDKISDNLRIPKDIISKIDSIIKYCTKPEFEMLLIMAENMTDVYEKQKSTVKPKTFAKTFIVFNKKRYNNTPDWVHMYFDKWLNKDIKELLKAYKQYKKHETDEMYLYDLVK